MPRFLTACGVAACLLASSPLRAQDPPSAQPPPTLRDIQITGARELPNGSVEDAIPVRVGKPFDVTTDKVASAVERAYREEGYTFARVKAAFDETSGVLTLTIDEGVIDGVEFQGVDRRLA